MVCSIYECNDDGPSHSIDPYDNAPFTPFQLTLLMDTKWQIAFDGWIKCGVLPSGWYWYTYISGVLYVHRCALLMCDNDGDDDDDDGDANER